MRKIGIVTIQDNKNIGNRLQNFALHTALGQLGYEAQSIWNFPNPGDRIFDLRRKIDRIKSEGLFTYAQQVFNSRIGSSGILPHAEIIGDLSGFSAKYLSYCELRYELDSDVSRIKDMCDAFVVGSDQVWNPWFRRFNSADFLEFARPSQRIAYAASFGIADLPRFARRRYRSALSEFQLISVREDAGAKIVEKLIGSRPPVLLDPTMLIDAAEWQSHASIAEVERRSGYVLSVLLSTNPAGYQTLQQEISAFAARSGLQIHDFIQTEFCKLSADTPWRFINMIRNAELVVTNSFHCAVFATMLHTPFRVVGRTNMNSRFDSLLERFQLQQCKHLPGSGELSIPAVDWGFVDKVLSQRREMSLGWLRDALDLTTSGVSGG